MNTKTILALVVAILVLYFGINAFDVVKNPDTNGTATTTPVVQGLEYRNNTYGFVVPLPESWRGFTVSESAKDGYKQVNIAHPLSTKENPRMDVPIIVVPIATWNTWYPPGHPEDGQHPFAAPVPATERARNNQYVFATAPRYNFSYLPGFEEVDLIVQKVKAFDIANPLVEYPRNLKISGFEIVDGKAKATIWDRCVGNGTLCNYAKPDTEVSQLDGDLQRHVEDGYTVGIYGYDYRFSEGGLSKFLILVGKDGKWRYDYLDCSGRDYCHYTLHYAVNDLTKISHRADGNFISFSNRIDHVMKDDTSIEGGEINLDKFLSSKKNHFVLNGY